MNKLAITDPEQMCCCLCGYVAQINDSYEIEHGEDEDWPICPKCGETNSGGYSSYAPAYLWPEECLKNILETQYFEPL